MISQYKHDQLERWTAQVRRQTKYDMAQLRLDRARAEQQIMQPHEAPLTGMVRWWQSTQQLVQGGVHALERAIAGALAPRTRPDRLLRDAGVTGR
jgi:hypothetical protein